MRHICISPNQQTLLGSCVSHDYDLLGLFLVFSCWAHWALYSSVPCKSLVDQPLASGPMFHATVLRLLFPLVNLLNLKR